MTSNRLARWSWVLLGLTIGVIVGGSLVRATGSGAGCGESWPRCQGSLFPLGGGTETTIEFAHRAATLLLGLVLVAFVVAAVRRGPAGRLLRRALGWVGAFFLGEVVIGAILVVAGWVDTDASIGRVIMVPLHLVNTFFLVAAVALVVHVANGGAWPRFDRRRRADRVGLAMLGAMLLVAASGGLNALADTLYPADTLVDGLRAEFGSDAPFLVRLRVLHPVIAIAGGLGVVMALRSAAFDQAGEVRTLANAAFVVVAVEAMIGLVNVILLTPVEIQLVHLLVADVLWVLVVFAALRVSTAQPADSKQLEAV